MMMIPTEPWNEIVPGLYQGGSWVSPEGFDAVMSLHSHGAPILDNDVEQARFFFHDGDSMPPDGEITAAVAWVWRHWMSGEKTLVRCQAGLNRSGLIVALTIMLNGTPADEAIDLIRTKRSPDALFNPVFVAYLRSLGTLYLGA